MQQTDINSSIPLAACPLVKNIKYQVMNIDNNSVKLAFIGYLNPCQTVKKDLKRPEDCFNTLYCIILLLSFLHHYSICFSF